MSAPTKTPSTVLTKDQEANGKTLLEQVIDETLARKLREADEYAIAIDKAQDHLQRSMLISSGINKLRGLLSQDVMEKYVMPLMNSPLGFLTDKDPSKKNNVETYPPEIVRECAIAALLAGLHLCGNEWNIIAGRMMVVKDGWRRKVRDIREVKEADVVVGTCQVDGAIAKVRVVAWAKVGNTTIQLLDGELKPGRTIQIPIKSAQYESVDTWKGKAERRAWKSLWERLTNGVVIADDDETAAPPTEAEGVTEPKLAETPPSKSDRLADELTGTGQATASAPSESQMAAQDQSDRVLELVKAAETLEAFDHIDGQIDRGRKIFGDAWAEPLAKASKEAYAAWNTKEGSPPAKTEEKREPVGAAPKGKKSMF